MKKTTKRVKLKITKDTKIELAKQDKVTVLGKYVAKILKALGHPEALVTDESDVFDFLDFFDESERIKQVKKAQKKLGIDIFPNDYIWEVAERMKEG